jgi:alpha-aminoadipate carrier protein LysW
MSAAAPCPVCDAAVSIPADAVVAELLRCRECGVELEIKSLDPLLLAEAPTEEEDWGQ